MWCALDIIEGADRGSGTIVAYNFYLISKGEYNNRLTGGPVRVKVAGNQISQDFDKILLSLDCSFYGVKFIKVLSPHISFCVSFQLFAYFVSF